MCPTGPFKTILALWLILDVIIYLNIPVAKSYIDDNIIFHNQIC